MKSRIEATSSCQDVVVAKNTTVVQERNHLLRTIDMFDMGSSELVYTSNESLRPGHHDIRQQWQPASEHELLRSRQLAGCQARSLQKAGNPDRGLDLQYPCEHLVDLQLILLPIAINEQHAHDPHAPSIEGNLASKQIQVTNDIRDCCGHSNKLDPGLPSYVFQRVFGKVLLSINPLERAIHLLVAFLSCKNEPRAVKKITLTPTCLHVVEHTPPGSNRVEHVEIHKRTVVAKDDRALVVWDLVTRKGDCSLVSLLKNRASMQVCRSNGVK